MSIPNCRRCELLTYSAQHHGPCVVIGGVRHHPLSNCVVRARDEELAPVRRSVAGLSSLANGGTIQIDTGTAVASVRVTPLADGMRLELAAGGWGPEGAGFARGVLEVDRGTYDRALERAEAAGGLVRLGDLLRRRGLAAGLSVDVRPMLGRGEEG